MNAITRVIADTVTLCEQEHWDGRVRADNHLLFLAGRCAYLLDLHDALRDDVSRDILLWLIRFRIARMYFDAARAATLFPGPIPPAMWDELRKRAASMPERVRNDYDIDRIETWLLKGYEIEGVFGAQQGDVVIDGGAYTGNTSIYFSEKVGDRGVVLAVEPAPDIHRNLVKSTRNHPNIRALNVALSDTAGSATMSGEGPASKLTAAGVSGPAGARSVATDTIDGIVKQTWLPRVDLIKLDVEGHEKQCLLGARETIRRHRPRMAVCVYHRTDDLFEIPRTILSLDENYAFYLRHNSFCEHETVLFCLPGEAKTDLSFEDRACPDQAALQAALSRSSPFDALMAGARAGG